MTDFSVAHGDVTQVESDLLLVKYARAFYGADAAVAEGESSPSGSALWMTCVRHPMST